MIPDTEALAEFLRARLFEAEAVAYESLDVTYRWSEDDLPKLVPIVHAPPTTEERKRVDHILADIHAKRRIIDLIDALQSVPAHQTLRFVLEELASVYAEHPDYRQEWMTLAQKQACLVAYLLGVRDEYRATVEQAFEAALQTGRCGVLVTHNPRTGAYAVGVSEDVPYGTIRHIQESE